MTPEDLEAIQNIGPKTVERIQAAVNSYFGQYEEALGVGEEESFEPVEGFLIAAESAPTSM